MNLEKRTIKSKKDGKEYIAYVLHIGLYNSPMFFPTKVEENYIDLYLQQHAHEDFKGDDLKDLDED